MNMNTLNRISALIVAVFGAICIALVLNFKEPTVEKKTKLLEVSSMESAGLSNVPIQPQSDMLIAVQAQTEAIKSVAASNIIIATKLDGIKKILKEVEKELSEIRRQMK